MATKTTTPRLSVLFAGILLINSSQSIRSGCFGSEYPSTVKTHLDRGTELMHQNKLRQAKTELEAAIKLEPACPEAYNNLALCLLQEGQLDKAKDKLQHALQADPSYLPSLNNMGATLYKQHNYAQAALYYRKALGTSAGQITNFQSAELLTNLANALRDNGDTSSALSFYNQAIQAQPDYAPVYNNLGLTHLRQNQDQQAEQEILQAVRLKPTYSEAYYNLGVVYRKLGNIDKAIEAFQNSLKYETNAAYQRETVNSIAELKKDKALYDLMTHACILLKNQEWKSAQAAYQEILSKQLDVSLAPIAWNNLGLAFAGQNNFSQSIESYKNALTLQPSFAEARYNMGQAFYNLEDYTQAETAFRKAIDDAHGKYPLAHNMLGIIFKQQGNIQSAIQEYKLAIAQSDEALPVVHFNLAKVLTKQNQKREAAKELKTYLDQAPFGSNANAAKALLKQLHVVTTVPTQD